MSSPDPFVEFLEEPNRADGTTTSTQRTLRFSDNRVTDGSVSVRDTLWLEYTPPLHFHSPLRLRTSLEFLVDRVVKRLRTTEVLKTV